jgi:hypothetical protein
MPPRVRTRANRNRTPPRSPTPNRPEDDPFMLSPETKRQKALQEQYTQTQKNANERAKKYAKAFEKFLKNNTSVNNKLVKKFKNIQNNKNKNHLQTNNKNFKNNVQLMNRPTYLLSDVLNSNSGKIRHVYSRDYLNKVFKNKTIHRGPHTGVPTSPDMMRNYNGVNINARRHAIFKTQKTLLIQVYGRETYYDTKLQTKHVTGQLQDHHIKLAHFVSMTTRGGTFFDFTKKFLRIDVRTIQPRRLYFKNLHNITEKEVNQVIGIVKLIGQLEVETPDMYLPFIHQLRVIFFAQRFNGVPPVIQKIINNYKPFYKEFKNLLNL